MQNGREPAGLRLAALAGFHSGPISAVYMACIGRWLTTPITGPVGKAVVQHTENALMQCCEPTLLSTDWFFEQTCQANQEKLDTPCCTIMCRARVRNKLDF